MKRVFSLLLTLIIVFGALTSVPVTASAAKEQVNKAIIFRLSEDKKSYSVVDCVEAVEGEIVVPATYKGKPVIAIDDWAFLGCRNMTSLIISEGVVSVGENAFLDCDSLSSITIPGTLADIHETFIRNFGSLSEINIGENNPQYSSVDGVLFNSDKTVLIHYPYGKTDSEYTIPDGVTTISAGAFSGCWRLKSVVVGDDVTTIGENAFRGCNYLTSITIPESVTSIKNKAFYECGKFSVLYSGSENAWKEITIEDGNSRLISATKHYNSTSHSYGDLLTEKPTCNNDGYEYYECSVCGIHNITKTIPASGHVSAGVNCEICGEQILDYTIYGDEVTIIKCNGIVKELVIPGTVEGLPVTSINDEAFCWSYIKSVEVPESVTYIGWSAFYSCSDLEEINVAEGNPVYSSVDGVLFNKDKTSLIQYPSGKTDAVYIFPDGVKDIDSEAFANAMYLESLAIPDGVTIIAFQTFCDCPNLTSVTIPDSVTTIYDYAFYGCSSLKSIIIPDSVTTIYDYAFYGCSSLKSIIIPDSVTHLDWGVFNRCTSLESVVIGDGVKIIGVDAFNRCINLESVTIGKNVKEIYSYAFYDCKKLKSLKLPESVDYIGEQVFDGCISLTSISLPKSMIEIASNAFYNCMNLESVKIPSGIKTVSDVVFGNCTSLKSVTFSDTVTNIDGLVFKNCTGLESVTFGKNVKKIGNIFRNCEKLKSVTIPGSVEKIKGWFFDGCDSLSDVYFQGTEEQWNKIDINKTNNDELFAANIHFLCGHKKTKWITDKKATVDKAGKKHKECTECGEVLETAKIKQLTCSKPKLKKVENTSSGVKISWSKVSGADSYRVYRKTGKKDWEYIGSTSKTYYTDKKAKTGTKYSYAIRAVNEAGNSSRSKELSIEFLTDPTLKTPKSTKKGVVLKWSKVKGADGYIIERKTGSGKYEKLKTIKGYKKVEYTDKKAKKGKKYTYRVKAYDGKTYSAYSNTKTIKDKY